MDDRRFDDLARGLAGGSRRVLLRRLLGGMAALGVVVGINQAGQDDVADAAPVGCKAAGKNCTKPSQCCPGLVCAAGQCVSPTPTPTPTNTPIPCHDPNPLSSYVLTCYNSSLTCEAEGNILRADCEDAFGDPVATSINVETCAADGYLIVNCNAALRCGTC
jgi:hypothetical protein